MTSPSTTVRSTRTPWLLVAVLASLMALVLASCSGAENSSESVAAPANSQEPDGLDPDLRQYYVINDSKHQSVSVSVYPDVEYRGWRGGVFTTEHPHHPQCTYPNGQAGSSFSTAQAGPGHTSKIGWVDRKEGDQDGPCFQTSVKRGGLGVVITNTPAEGDSQWKSYGTHKSAFVLSEERGEDPHMVNWDTTPHVKDDKNYGGITRPGGALPIDALPLPYTVELTLDQNARVNIVIKDLPEVSGDVQALVDLGCGSAETAKENCYYDAKESVPEQQKPVLYGNVVENCSAHSTSPHKHQVTESVSNSESWTFGESATVEASEKVSIPPVTDVSWKAAFTKSWSHGYGKTVTLTESNTMDIDPGFKGAWYLSFGQFLVNGDLIVRDLTDGAAKKIARQSNFKIPVNNSGSTTGGVELYPHKLSSWYGECGKEFTGPESASSTQDLTALRGE